MSQTSIQEEVVEAVAGVVDGHMAEAMESGDKAAVEAAGVDLLPKIIFICKQNGRNYPEINVMS